MTWFPSVPSITFIFTLLGATLSIFMFWYSYSDCVVSSSFVTHAIILVSPRSVIVRSCVNPVAVCSACVLLLLESSSLFPILLCPTILYFSFLPPVSSPFILIVTCPLYQLFSPCAPVIISIVGAFSLASLLLTVTYAYPTFPLLDITFIVYVPAFVMFLSVSLP